MGRAELNGQVAWQPIRWRIRRRRRATPSRCSRWCSLRQEGKSWSKRLRALGGPPHAGRPGQLAPPADRVRPLGDGRYERRPSLTPTASRGWSSSVGCLARGPAHAVGRSRPQRLEALDGHDPSRCRAGRAPAAAGRPSRFRPASRPGTRSRRDGAGRGDPRRHHSDAGGKATPRADIGALADPRGSTGPPSRCQDEAAGRRHFDGEAARFRPFDSGGSETTGVAAGREPLQLGPATSIRRPDGAATHDIGSRWAAA